MSEETTNELSRLEEEGELAADYLEELLDIADLDGDIEIDVENGRASVEIISEDPSALDHLVRRRWRSCRRPSGTDAPCCSD